MAIPLRASNKQRVNLKKEVDYGDPTGLVIDTRLNGLRIVPRKDGSTSYFMAAGSSLATVATRIDNFATFAANGQLTFQDPLFIWASILGPPVTTTPGGATLAREHLFAWDGFEIVNPVSYAMVYGDVNSAVLVPGAIFNSLSYTIGRGGAPEITANGFGKAQSLNQVIYPRQSSFTLAITGTAGTYALTWAGQTTTNIAFNANAATILAALDALSNVAPGDVTVTGASQPFTIAATATGAFAGLDVTATVDPALLTGGTATLTETVAGGPVVSIPATPVSPLLFDAWVDATEWADLGTTQTLGCLEFGMNVGDRHVRVQPLVSDQSEDGIAESDSQTHTVTMRFLYDAVAEGMFAHLDAGTMLFVRLQALGAVNSIETGQRYEYLHDTAILLSEVGAPEPFGGGVMSINLTGQLAADSASGNAVRVLLRNEVAAIP